ncbi:MAG: peroxiredoxin [Akkermansiaceae bacterium]|jgi:thioredoxin-dependent peroxiredoxin|nr:peroxiredoxin [Akkermansiaceae bacterium]
MKPVVGEPAPDFSTLAVCPNGGGTVPVSLSELRGKRVILVFYPKDNTPGCTMQACAIRDQWNTLKDKAVIYGVSGDDEASHKKFITKRKLPYPLLVDTAHQISEAYGAWVQKSLFGKKYMGIERSTFVIGVDGMLEHAFERVSPLKHIGLLLDALK